MEMFPGQKKGFCIHGELLCECSARSNIDRSKQTYSIPQPLLWARGPGGRFMEVGMQVAFISLPPEYRSPPSHCIARFPDLHRRVGVYPRVAPDNILKYQVVPLVPGILCRLGPFQ